MKRKINPYKVGGAVLKAAGAGVTVVGTAGEYFLTERYNPANWIMYGSYLWMWGDILDGIDIYRKEELDSGTKTRLAGDGLKVLSAGWLGTMSLVYKGLNPLKLVVPIGESFGIYTIGIILDYTGKKIKGKTSKRHKIAKELREVSKGLEDKKIPIEEIEWEFGAIQEELEKLKAIKTDSIKN